VILSRSQWCSSVDWWFGSRSFLPSLTLMSYHQSKTKVSSNGCSDPADRLRTFDSSSDPSTGSHPAKGPYCRRPPVRFIILSSALWGKSFFRLSL